MGASFLEFGLLIQTNASSESYLCPVSPYMHGLYKPFDIELSSYIEEVSTGLSKNYHL